MDYACDNALVQKIDSNLQMVAYLDKISGAASKKT